MRIAMVVPSFYPATAYGGPIFSTLHTCENLARLDDVKVYVSTTNANMNSKLDVETNSWKAFEKNFFVKYYNETKVNVLSFGLLFNLWRDIKGADVVHVQYMFNTSTIIALIYAKLFAKPILLSPRGALCHWCLLQGSRLKKKWLEFLIKPFVNTIMWHATAQQEKDDILSQFPDAKVVVIPNGVEFGTYQISLKLSTDEFCHTFTKEYSETNQIIVSMGRLQKVKGFDILIASFAKVNECFPKAKLFIAGQDEGEKVALIKQIAELGLEDKVFLIGEISGQDKINFLANADLFVLSSHTENFGNVYVESLASGTPVVASKGTPWSEVEKANCGKWVNNSVEETAQAIIDMLGENREQMRANSKNLAEKYDWRNIAVQFKVIFEKMSSQTK